MTGAFATAHAKEVSGASDVFGGGRERCFKLVLHACLWPAGASSDSTASLGGGLGSRFRTNLCGMARHFSSRMFPALDLHHAPWRSDVAEPLCSGGASTGSVSFGGVRVRQKLCPFGVAVASLRPGISQEGPQAPPHRTLLAGTSDSCQSGLSIRPSF